ncbi:MAG TPA: L-seryl-tRNA(Sec) selenium transferase [Myxococcota bacterium]|nr:L-seryl-tRNA(Sec) selenium transferase [Myxococcota bacterium]HRY96484.1 L-seryl-tRNA(Sec) selenium transferase [Myxococcota bacterium]
MPQDRNPLLRSLPSVDEVLARPDLAALLREHPRPLVVEAVRRAIDARRQALLAGGDGGGGGEVDGPAVAAALAGWRRARLRRVLNATGILLHTNLGRAPLSAAAVERLAATAAGYSNLELDLGSGERGSRMDAVRALLLERTGAEAGLVVNNCAAAVYLALRALAAGREVLVSRGELVEIGGSFRVPDVMAASGARLVEVGTTNRTRLEDYARAMGPETGLLLKVHRSNFEIVGFTEEVEPRALAGLARERGVPFLWDMGAACLLPGLPPELAGVPDAAAALGQGPDLICFSGDKLLGGPQCGVLLGRAALIARLAKDPMARALRVGKLTLAALEATLDAYRGGEQGARAIPLVAMLLAEPEALARRAQALRAALAPVCGAAEVVASEAQVGGGALPLLRLPSFAVAVRPGAGSAAELATRLRAGEPAVLGRVHEERVLLDVRTLVGEGEVAELAAAVARALA